MAQIETADRRIKLSLPAIATLSAILAIFLWAAGVVAGYMAYTRSMSEVIAKYDAVAKRLDSAEDLLGELRGDMKYTRQDIAEIKTYILPKK